MGTTESNGTITSTAHAGRSTVNHTYRRRIAPLTIVEKNEFLSQRSKPMERWKEL